MRNRAGVRDPNVADYIKKSMWQIMSGRGFVDNSENGEHTPPTYTTAYQTEVSIESQTKNVVTTRLSLD